LRAEFGLDEVSPADILVVPGGPGVRPLLGDENLLAWLRRVHEQTRWTSSVCTGSLLLAAAGLLEGLPATTHWDAMGDLERYGAQPVSQRVIVNGKIVMGAGVSAGIDMALTLAPPFSAGRPDQVDASVLELARGGLDRVPAR